MAPFHFSRSIVDKQYILFIFLDDAISIISIIMASSICACVNCSAKQEAGRNYNLIFGIIDKEFKDYVISYGKGKTRSPLRDDYLCRKCLEILRRKSKAEQKGSYYSPWKKTAENTQEQQRHARERNGCHFCCWVLCEKNGTERRITAWSFHESVAINTDVELPVDEDLINDKVMVCNKCHMKTLNPARSQQKVDTTSVQSSTDLNSLSFGSVPSTVFSTDGSQETISSGSLAPFNTANISEQTILYRACKIINDTICKSKEEIQNYFKSEA